MCHEREEVNANLPSVLHQLVLLGSSEGINKILSESCSHRTQGLAFNLSIQSSVWT